MKKEYHIRKVIGKGSFATVYRAIHRRTKQNVAIKIISREKLKDTNINIQNEITIAPKLQHHNILKFYHVELSKNNLYMISDLCDFTLTKALSDKKKFIDYIKKNINIGNDIIYDNKILPEKYLIYIIKQIFDGLEYLYDRNIFHRDIKPDNILFKDGILKISDFGFAKELYTNSDISNTFCGSPLYMAPEILLQQPYSNKSDIWSLGIMIYSIIYNDHPCSNVTNVYNLIKFYESSSPIKFPYTKYSVEIIDLLRKMLVYDVNKRIGWNELFSYQYINEIYKSFNINKIIPSSISFSDNISDMVSIGNNINHNNINNINININHNNVNNIQKRSKPINIINKTKLDNSNNNINDIFLNVNYHSQNKINESREIITDIVDDIITNVIGLSHNNFLSTRLSPNYFDDDIILPIANIGNSAPLCTVSKQSIKYDEDYFTYNITYSEELPQIVNDDTNTGSYITYPFQWIKRYFSL